MKRRRQYIGLMPYVRINTILQDPLQPNGMLELKYPEGKNQGNFFGAIDHTLGIEARFFRSPRDFIVQPTPDKILIHWAANINVPAGALLNFQLQEQGGDYYHDNATGVTINNMVAAPTFLVNLGSVLDRNPQYYVPPTRASAPGRFTLLKNKPDVPRNVIVQSSGNESGRVFRVDGEDIYFRPMVEHIKGPGNGVANGKKAFAKINKITVSEATEGEISIGMGNRIGLPVFIPAPGYVLMELVNGMQVAGGLLIPGEINVPGPSSGDRRGTYTPPPSITMNGLDTIQLFLILPNPGNVGTPDYAGE